MTYVEATKFLYMRGIDARTRAEALYNAKRDVFAVCDGLFISFNPSTRLFVIS